MGKETSRRTFLKAVIASPFIYAALTAPDAADAAGQKKFYDRAIDGKRVIYTPGKDFLFVTTPDRMEIHSDGLIEIIEDYDRNGKIGNHPNDKYIVKRGRCSVTFTSDYVIDQNGHTISGEDTIAKEALKESNAQLYKANEQYKYLKTQIAKDIRQDLQNPCE